MFIQHRRNHSIHDKRGAVLVTKAEQTSDHGIASRDIKQQQQRQRGKVLILDDDYGVCDGDSKTSSLDGKP